MKYADCMIAWTPTWEPRSELPGKGTKGRIVVGPWPDETGWSKPYAQSVGACFNHVREMTGQEQLTQMLADFHTAVVRDGIEPLTAHRAFLAIDEYRRVIAPEIEGAE